MRKPAMDGFWWICELEQIIEDPVDMWRNDNVKTTLQRR